VNIYGAHSVNAEGMQILVNQQHERVKDNHKPTLYYTISLQKKCSD